MRRCLAAWSPVVPPSCRRRRQRRGATAPQPRPPEAAGAGQITMHQTSATRIFHGCESVPDKDPKKWHRYMERMRRAGWKRVILFVHEEDEERVRRYVARLIARRTPPTDPGEGSRD